MAVYIPIRPKWNPRGVVINYVHGDKLCVRSWPKGYHDANSPAQQRQRRRMRQICNALPYLKVLLSEGFDPQTKRNGRRIGGYHVAVSTALREWFTQTAQGDTLDLVRLQLCNGARNLPIGLRVESSMGMLRIRWTVPLPWRGAKMLIAARLSSANHWTCASIALGETETAVAFSLPKAWRGKAIETWVAFMGKGKGVKTRTRYTPLSAFGSPGSSPKPTPRDNPRAIPLAPARKWAKGHAPRPAQPIPPGCLHACKFRLPRLYCTQKE